MADELSGGGGLTAFMKVMTDEQMEVLREQIAVYATICEQLVEMHRSLTAQNDRAGPRLGSLYSDPLIMSSNSHNITGRQRWSPTPKQLQILERIFNQGVSSPGKLKVPEITAELLQHGQVTDTNVYNWFQNRRARSKRKQQPATVHNSNAESEVETEETHSNDKKKTQDLETANLSSSRARAEEDVCFQKSIASSGILYHVDPSSSKPENELFQEAGNDSFEQMDFYGSVMQQNPRMDHLIGKMDVGGSCDSYLLHEDYDTAG